MGQTLQFPSSTQLRFQCDKNATWENSADGKVDQYLVNITYVDDPLEIQVSKNNTQYTFCEQNLQLLHCTKSSKGPYHQVLCVLHMYA